MGVSTSPVLRFLRREAVASSQALMPLLLCWAWKHRPHGSEHAAAQLVWNSIRAGVRRTWSLWVKSESVGLVDEARPNRPNGFKLPEPKCAECCLWASMRGAAMTGPPHGGKRFDRHLVGDQLC